MEDSKLDQGPGMKSETATHSNDKGFTIVAKVISRQGTCDFGHQIGDEVVFAMRYGADFPWLKENRDASTHACPDAHNPVVFEIRRIRKEIG